jgi:hypothetical protein
MKRREFFATTLVGARVERDSQSFAPVDIASMADLHDDYHQFPVGDFVEDSIHALTNAIPRLARQLFATRRPRIIRQRTNALQDSSDVRLWKRAEVFGDTDFLKTSS